MNLDVFPEVQLCTCTHMSTHKAVGHSFLVLPVSLWKGPQWCLLTGVLLDLGQDGCLLLGNDIAAQRNSTLKVVERKENLENKWDLTNICRVNP